MTPKPIPDAIPNLPPECQAALAYLEHDLPGWPYQHTLDEPFLTELVEDFPHVDLLEQIKLFRWFHHNSAPPRNPRLALRRWIANAKYP